MNFAFNGTNTMKNSFQLAIKTTILAVVMMVATLSNFATAGLSDALVVFQSGDWSVRRSVDLFSDDVACIGIYKADFDVQLSGDSLFVRVRGGIQGIRSRHGTQPPDELRLPTEVKEAVSTVIFNGSRLTRLLNTDRVRIQVLTKHST